jgi:hypothetical protein
LKDQVDNAFFAATTSTTAGLAIKEKSSKEAISKKAA